MSPEAVVFIIDHDSVMLRRIHDVVTSAGFLAERYSSGKSFLDDYEFTVPGCVIADVRMPGISGLALMWQLVDAGGTIPVILISGYGDVATAVTAMKKGAFDFLEQPIADQTLIECINQAINVDTTRRDAQSKKNEIRIRFDRLTPRERQVMNLVVVGQPNKTIAHELGCSGKTIEVHRSRVMSKMEAPSLAKLVIMSMALSGEVRHAMAV